MLKKLLEARGVEISGNPRALHGRPPERQADGGNVLTPRPLIVRRLLAIRRSYWPSTNRCR